MNYYRRYIGDYLKKTARLSMLEHGAYNLLLDYYYVEERPIPLDLAEVYRMVRATAAVERRAVERVLSVFFTRTEDGFRNIRADEEISKGSSAIEQMADAGRRGADRKWGKSRSASATRAQRLAEARAKGTHTEAEWSSLVDICGNHCVRCGVSAESVRGGRLVKDHISPIYQGGDDSIENLQPMCPNCNSSKGPDKTDFRERLPVAWRKRLLECLAKMPGVVPAGGDRTTNHQPPTKPPSAGRGRDTASTDFDQVWQALPKRQGNNPRGRAERAFRARLAEGAQPQEVLAGALRYARFCEATGKAGSEYVMQGATFLGPERPFLQPWIVAAAAPSWWVSPDSILAKAKELGISTRGESTEALKATIRQKLGAPA
jgi:uncharacterized protein YdaU (DUF1376 family)